MLRECAEAVEALTAVRPLVLEDLHWSDQATLALVAYLAQRRASARLLLLGTYRPVDVIVHGHPLQAVKTALTLHGRCVELVLEVLPAAAVAAVVAARLPGPALPPAVIAALYRRTDGHPLFLVQVVEALQRQDVLVEEAGRWVLAGGLAALEAVVPESLRALIEQQFDGLRAEVQQALEAASVAGVDWPVAAVAAGMEADMDQVEEWCAGLARQGQFVQAGALVVWPDGTVGGSYQFRHALYQQVVYDRIAVGRRVRLHQRIAWRVEVGYGTQAHEVAAELAGHFEHGHDPERAVRYRQQAAAQALGRYAYPEAIGHLTRGVELLQTLPETPARTRQELDMQLALSNALAATKGLAAPEAGHAYTRARELCQQVGETPQFFAVLDGLVPFYIGRGEFQTARELAEDMLSLAQRVPNPVDLGKAHIMLGSVLWSVGEWDTARRHLEQGIALSKPQPHDASRRPPDVVHHVVFALSRLAQVLWYLGYPDQALQRSQEALTLARELSYPESLATALVFAANNHFRRREGQRTYEQAEAARVLSGEQEFAQRWAEATMLRGWALVAQGQGPAGLVQIREGLAVYRATGVETGGLYLIMLAEASGSVGQTEEGLQVVTEALALSTRNGEGQWAAESYRLKGELLLRHASAPYAEAETCFCQALALARRQQVKVLELRAATSLARLWQQHGKQDEARALLAPLYSWFTEGFDTAALQEAKALLEALAWWTGRGDVDTASGPVAG
jgi:predicted ATPase